LTAETQYSDAARRLSDAVNVHLLGQGTAVAGRWIAARLSDGGSDGVLYDTKADAVRHQLHEQLCCYVMIPLDGMSPRQAENYLRFNRQLYDAGMRITDPNAHTAMPMDPRQYRSGLILPPPRKVRR
jgi:hypothetical protein